MSTVHDENKAMLAQVVSALPKWENRLLFIGGATLGFYLEEGLHGLLRRTVNVDLVVEVASLSKFYLLADDLRKAGFVELPERTSRWKYKGLLLDILPSEVCELQSSKPWLQEAFTRAVKQNLDANASILIPTLMDFIALKFQAFEDRGNRDFLEKDMEDIVTVIDGCSPDLLQVINLSSKSKEFLALNLKKICTDPGFLNLMPGMLPIRSMPRVLRFKARVRNYIGCSKVPDIPLL